MHGGRLIMNYLSLRMSLYHLVCCMCIPYTKISLWVNLNFLCVLCISHTLHLQIDTLAQSTLSNMAAGDASQTTPVKIMHVLCCVVFTKLSNAILISIKVLLVTWCVLIN